MAGSVSPISGYRSLEIQRPSHGQPNRSATVPAPRTAASAATGP